MTVKIMIVGVGGQGTLLASKLLGKILIERGYDVKVAELHGMSQRGGSVVTYVKYGDRVFSPLIEEGEADYIVSFEKLEAARWAKCLKKGGKIIVNTQQIDPMPVTSGLAEYPSGILDELCEAGLDVDALDALSLAVEAGSPKCVNIVLMGKLAKHLGMTKEEWLDAIEKSVKPALVQMNRKAFTLGYETERNTQK